jgi:membrane associated rhomboid family serine protease
MKQTPVQMNLTITPMVKLLIIVNLVIWVVLQILMEAWAKIPFTKYFALYPGKFIYEFALWQPLTYMFLHSMQVSHIVFNMLMLWFVGGELEQRWGRKFFVSYYLISGAGAALIYCFVVAIYSLLSGSQQGLVVPVIGASGAIFGLLLAYGILFGERTMHFMMVFPMKAKYFVMILGAIEVMSILTSGVVGGEVAYLAHLGGILSGYLTLLGWTRIQQSSWRRTPKKKGAGRLRLVVDNNKSKDQNKGNNDPKYWN